MHLYQSIFAYFLYYIIITMKVSNVFTKMFLYDIIILNVETLDICEKYGTIGPCWIINQHGVCCLLIN